MWKKERSNKKNLLKKRPILNRKKTPKRFQLMEKETKKSEPYTKFSI